MPGARGGTGLAERWRFGAALGATLCPPKIGTLSFVRVRVCSELQLRICVWLCVPDLGGPVPDSRGSPLWRARQSMASTLVFVSLGVHAIVQ